MFVKHFQVLIFIELFTILLFGIHIIILLFRIYLRNIKHFRVDIQLYQNEWKLEKREIVWKNTTLAGRSVFTQFRVFPIFTSVDITVYQYGKHVLYFFYNIAQRTLTEEWQGIFRVDIELYQHGS